MNSEDLKKIRHALEHLRDDIKLRSAMQDDYVEGKVFVGSSAWSGLIDSIQRVAALSQQEAEPVASVSQHMQCVHGADLNANCYLCRDVKWPATPATQSVPQDVEEFVLSHSLGNGKEIQCSIEQFYTFLSQRDAGSVRVPVEFIDILRDAPELNTSNYDHDQVCRLNAAVIDAFSVLTASKEGV